ncbi:hypothetical protein ACWF5H_11500 [Arthrobacter sp. NPDC055138]
MPVHREHTQAGELKKAEAPETANEWLSAIPLGRAALPREVAAVICHLGSDASFTNGLVYDLGGGSTAGRFIPHEGTESVAEELTHS